MGKKEGTAIIFMGLGIIAIYLGVSGNLQSFWTGLTGGYGDESSDDKSGGGATGSGKNMGDIVDGLDQSDIDRIKNNIGPKAGAGDPNAGTTLSQPVGSFFVLPTGIAAVSDAGIY